MKTPSIELLVESTVVAMLAAAAGCGAVAPEPAASGDAGPVVDAAKPYDAGHLDAGVDADPCAPPSRGYSLTACGEAGDRLGPSGGSCTPVYRQMPCGLEVDAGACGFQNLFDVDCRALCTVNDAGPYALSCGLQTYSGGAREILCEWECPGGRRPGGQAPERARGGTALGRLFADLARLEAVSITAFGDLARELDRHGASASLVARARRARRDEVRHARAAWSLAARFGAAPKRLPRPRRASARTAIELAEENAAEGCVRETLGAIVAAFQARAAGDPEIATTMAGIAADEADHARLAWDVDSFLAPRLDAEGRARRARAMRAAVDDLRREIASSAEAPERRVSGMPSRAVTRLALSRIEAAVDAALA